MPRDERTNADLYDVWRAKLARRNLAWARATLLEMRPLPPGIPHGSALAGMILAWLAYGDAHMELYGSGIGDDYVLGPAWAKIGRAMLALLNGDLRGQAGQIDAGALDELIRTVLRHHGKRDS